ncbi:MAG: YeeE/YedE family protein [Bacillota bacterium]
MKKGEKVLGFVAILALFIFGSNFLKTDILFFRLLVGAGLGYSLARAYTGFAGSVNRAYRTGSTKLMRTLMFMFFLTAVIVAGFLFKSDPLSYNLWIRPINLGLLIGGFLFGFGMSLSVCCASGVLTDLSQGFPRAFITLIFFGLGVFVGFPFQNMADWIRRSWIDTPVGDQLDGGVFLPDLFKWDGMEGYLGALLFIGLLCAIVSFISYYYEKKQKEKGKYVGHMMEKQQENRDKMDLEKHGVFSTETYKHLFIKPWTLKQGAVVIIVLFAVLMGVTGAGWGASQPYGIWFGKILMLFGVSAESISEFVNMAPDPFELPFFQHQISVQNFGIIVGTIIYLLTAGKFGEAFKSGWQITGKEVFVYALGGITMGFGTRLANGCNVGALYTPIANLSLSGWFFLITMIIGGIVSNKLSENVFKM